MRKKAFCEVETNYLQYYLLNGTNEPCGFKHSTIDSDGGVYRAFLKHRVVK